jgi:asparagine synthase (glutamine-hydrolysing)
MVSTCERYVLTFNGEIYNFPEIRLQLESKGLAPPWRGHSDTEVLLAAVSAWGFSGSLLAQLNGMFAFALWDRQRRLLHLARDRVGEKPLYYGLSDGSVLFCSELKALKIVPGWSGKVSRDAAACFMRHGYIAAPESIYSDIMKLPPGSCVTINPSVANSIGVPWSYASVRSTEPAESTYAIDRAWIDECEVVLQRAVSLRMVADVPVGAFLSGGVDSSLVVALMQQQASQPVRTFAIGFNEAGYDETASAQAVADYLGTKHTEIYVSSQQAMETIPGLPEIYDEPFADPSQIPAYLLARLAREQVTVTLSGDGGDELFYGYPRYRITSRLWAHLRHVPLPIRRLAEALLARTPTSFINWLLRDAERSVDSFGREYSPGDRLKKLEGLLSARSPYHLYGALVSAWNDPPVIGPSTGKLGLFATLQIPVDEVDIDRWMTDVDMSTYLPDDILVKVDRATMAVGLENRVPLLDPNVVDFAARLPKSLKWREGRGKWILRQVVTRHLPARLFDRPKQGFSVPIGPWIKGPLREWAEDLLSEEALRDVGILDTVPIRKRWLQHLSGERNWGNALWNALMFQAWARQQTAG